MARVQLVIKIALALVWLLVVVGSAMPIVRVGHWWVRMFDFPRVQLLVIGVAAACAWSFCFPLHSRLTQVSLFLLVSALALQVARILPFTPLWAPEVPHVLDLAPRGETLSVLTANVLFENDRHDELIALIRSTAPDLVLLVETDAVWTTALEELSEEWPARIVEPRPDGYGLLALSRYPLERAEVQNLVSESRPSIDAVVRLPSGRRVRWIGLHPAPPGLQRDDGSRHDSRRRDAELLIVARDIADEALPVIVCGDFNDTAWSHTTRLFKRIAGMLDPRVGRGLFNTYHASTPLLRYPIDHVFLSSDFALEGLSVLPPFGSDHLAMVARIRLLAGDDALDVEEPEPVDGDEREAEALIEEGLEDVEHERSDDPRASD